MKKGEEYKLYTLLYSPQMKILAVLNRLTKGGKVPVRKEILVSEAAVWFSPDSIHSGKMSVNYYLGKMIEEGMVKVITDKKGTSYVAPSEDFRYSIELRKIVPANLSLAALILAFINFLLAITVVLNPLHLVMSLLILGVVASIYVSYYYIYVIKTPKRPELYLPEVTSPAEATEKGEKVA